MSDLLTTVDADAVIGEEYDAFKSEVIGTAGARLAASNIHFADLDMDGFYNQAWFGLYTKLRDGQDVDNRKGLLVQMTYRRAIDEFRRMHPDRQAGPAMLEAVGYEDPIEDTLDQRRAFSQFVEAMRSELNQRELTAATLCYVYGLTRPEAAEQLGVRPKRMEKIMDEVSRKLRPLLSSIKEGTWCEDRAVLINQFALGALEPDSPEYREAVEHLETCSGCRRHVLAARGLTAATVPGLLFIGAIGATGVAAGTAAASTAQNSGAGASTAGGSAGAGVAQVAAVVAAVVAVAAGGFFVINSMTGEKQAAAPAPAAPAEQPAQKPTAKKPTAKKASKPAPQPALEPAPQQPAPPVVTPEPPSVAPEQPQPTPANPSTDAGSEFDLQ